MSGDQIKKSNFHYTRLSTDYGVASSLSPLPRLVPRQTVQGCIGSESMATCVILSDSEFEPCLPRQKAKTSTTRNLCGMTGDLKTNAVYILKK